MTPMQFNAKTRNLAVKTGLSAQLVQRHYMMDKMLEKISESPYKDQFILKGGFLLGSKYGIQKRSTIDIDTTILFEKVTKEKITDVLTDLIKKPTKEGIRFEIQSIQETREADFYPGYQVKLVAWLEKIRVPFKMDITTGDNIYLQVDIHQHTLMFDEKSIEILAYPTEQIIAEKLSAIISYGKDNSRAKDFYDLYTIPKLESIEVSQLYISVRNTFDQRGDKESFKFYYQREIEALKSSRELERHWLKYQSLNPFAEEISYQETVASIDQLLQKLLAVEGGY